MFDEKVDKAYDRCWLVMKHMFPGDTVIISEKSSLEIINPEYSKWLANMRNLLSDYTIDLLNSIGYKIKE